MRKLLAVVVLWIFAISCLAQGAPQAHAPAKSTVTGRVYCADTGLPARFATVQLHPDKLPEEIMPESRDIAAGIEKAMQGGALTALTRIDGSFRMENVPPGIYYVIPQLAGYVSPLVGQLSMDEVLTLNEEKRKQIVIDLQRVVVESGHPVNLELKLERGGALSGQILYDDGTPAENVLTKLFLKQKNGTWKQVLVNKYRIGIVAGATDDRGHYRYSGLPAGEYGVMAELPTTQVSVIPGMSAASVQIHLNDELHLFSGNVFRLREMKGYTLALGEEQDGADLVFPLNGLFKVSGYVVAGKDQHLVPTGNVDLLDPVDRAELRSGFVAIDGSFSFDYVPAGDYLMHVTQAADLDPSTKREIRDSAWDTYLANAQRKHAHDYGDADLPLTVHEDTMEITLPVPEVPKKK